MSQLLPCPFCGGSELETFANTIECIKCGAQGHTQEGPELTTNPYVRDGDWNTRAALSQNSAEAWQDISSAPKDGTRLLVFTPKYGPSTAHFSGDRWHIHSCLYQGAEITKWQPLPAPPSPKPSISGEKTT